MADQAGRGGRERQGNYQRNEELLGSDEGEELQNDGPPAIPEAPQRESASQCGAATVYCRCLVGVTY